MGSTGDRVERRRWRGRSERWEALGSGAEEMVGRTWMSEAASSETEHAAMESRDAWRVGAAAESPPAPAGGALLGVARMKGLIAPRHPQRDSVVLLEMTPQRPSVNQTASPSPHQAWATS